MCRIFAVICVILAVGASQDLLAQDKPVRLSAFGPRTDIHGDALPEGAIARLGTNRFRPLDGFAGLAFSPDGRILASTGANGISLWDTCTGQLLRRAEASDDPEGVSESLTATCRFLPDGKTLIGPGFQSIPIQFWDVATGKEISRFPNPPCENPQAPAHLEVSSDGKLVATAAGPVTVWDVATGKRLARLARKSARVHAMTWVPAAKCLAVIWENDRFGFPIQVWEFDSGKQRNLEVEAVEKGSYPRRLKFSPDGKTFALALDGQKEIRLHDGTTGNEIGRLIGHRTFVWNLEFSPDGVHLASLGTDATLRLWRLKDRREIARIDVPAYYQRAIAFSRDGKMLATPGERSEIRLREVPSLKEKVVTVAGPFDTTMPVGFTPDGKTLFTKGDALRVWDVARSKESRAPLRHLRGLFPALSPDGKFLAYGRIGLGIEILDASTGKKRMSISSPKPSKNTDMVPVVFSPDSKVMASYHPAAGLTLFEAASGRKVRTIEVPLDGSLSAYMTIISRDGQLLATVREGELTLFEVGTGKVIAHLSALDRHIHCLAFAPDGKMVAWGEGSVARLVEVASGKPRGQFSHHSRGLADIHYSPCGGLIVTTSWNGFSVWDVAAGELLARFEQPASSLEGLVFSTDGKVFATGSADTSVLIWETAFFLAKRRTVGSIPRQDIVEMWDHLKDDDAERAYRAMQKLIANPAQSIPLLRERMGPTPMPDEKRIGKLITMLSSNQYVDRERAATELKQIGEPAQPTLEQHVKSAPTLETRRRIEDLLQTSSSVSGNYLRELRALEVLERIGTPNGVRILEAVASGFPAARRTREAKACLARMTR